MKNFTKCLPDFRQQAFLKIRSHEEIREQRRLAALARNREPAIPERDEQIHYHVYLVLAWSGTPVNQQPDEHTMIEWFTLAQAVELKLAHPAYPQLFARVLSSAAPA